MKLVLSPAKSLNYESELPTTNFSEAKCPRAEWRKPKCPEATFPKAKCLKAICPKERFPKVSVLKFNWRKLNSLRVTVLKPYVPTLIFRKLASLELHVLSPNCENHSPSSQVPIAKCPEATGTKAKCHEKELAES